jgi:hypothetical protein
MQELAPSPSPAAGPIPYGLVSLWDMMNFSVHTLLATITFIAHVHKDTTDAQVVDRDLTAEQRQMLKSELENLHAMCTSHGLQRAEARVRRLRADLEKGSFLTARRLHIDTSTLHQALVDDIQEEHFYHYPRDKAHLVLAVSSHWARTLVAFPTAKPDIEAGVDCFALGHATASVFHMMRVAEYGLRGLAKERKITLPSGPIEWATWQDLIQQIRSKARDISNSVPKGPKRDAVREFYTGALGEFEAFKDEYRNDVMHARKSYEEPIAFNVMNHVRGFMERLSARTNQKGRRIRWS